ncbi:hypothetical protein FSHL1_005451 [Fusarium sambucinum]
MAELLGVVAGGAGLVSLALHAPIILQEQLGPIMLEKCRSRSASVVARLHSLVQAIPITASKRELIRAAFRSGQLKSELDEL